MKCKVLVVGENYHFGSNRAGNYEMLRRLGEEHGVKVIAVPSVQYEGESGSAVPVSVSASLIRIWKAPIAC